MLETFGEYMYYLLSTPFKQARKARNQWYIYFKVTGRLFDENKTMLRRAREEGMVRTASPRMLPEHGLDRKLTRYEGETWENFRVRLMMYADTCRLGGTEVGTLQAVRIWDASTGSLLIEITRTRATMNWAVTVAMAAPATPMPGIGPRPKISSGSNTILAPMPIQLATKGVLLLPEAV